VNAKKLIEAIRPLFNLRTSAWKKKFRIAKRKANRATTPRSIRDLLYGAPSMSPRKAETLRKFRARRRKLTKITKRSRRINRCK
jgi:hypothetical protein